MSFDDPIQCSSIRRLFPDGLIIGDKGSAWQYMRVPNRATDGLDADAFALAYGPTHDTLCRLGRLSKTIGAQRIEDGYRAAHVLAVNMPMNFRANRGPLYEHHRSTHQYRSVPRRLNAIGVNLLSGLHAPTWRKRLSNWIEQLVTDAASVLDRSFYERDLEQWLTIGSRAGLQALTRSEIQVLDGWWNHGGRPDVPFIRHSSHIHVLSDPKVAGALDALHHKGVPCDEWRHHVQFGHHVVSFAAIRAFDDKARDADSEAGQWGQLLFEGAPQALAISIRTALEPNKVVLDQLRKDVSRTRHDISERMKATKAVEASELEARLGRLTALLDTMIVEVPEPICEGAAITVAFDGLIDDYDLLGHDMGLDIVPLDYRQAAAKADMGLGSLIRANPHRHDLTIGMVSGAGLNAQTEIGDAEGALAGWTLDNGQPVYASLKAAAAHDGTSLAAVVGRSRSGKSFFAQYVADQWVRGGADGVFINPKVRDSLRRFAEAIGGRVITLSDLIGADGECDNEGIFDQMKTEDAGDAVLATSSFLLSACRGGLSVAQEASVLAALAWGHKHGRRATMAALEFAHREGKLDAAAWLTISNVYDGSPVFRLSAGYRADAALALGSGLTLIEVGSAPFSIPTDPTSENMSLIEKVSIATIQTMLLASVTALAYRGAFVTIDEFHVVMRSAPGMVDYLARIVSSLDVHVTVLTQKFKDILNINENGRSEGPIVAFAAYYAFALESAQDARYGCELYGLEPTKARIDAWCAPAGSDDGFQAVRAIGKGAYCRVKDRAGRIGVFEGSPTRAELMRFTTNPEDRRELEAEEAAQRGA